MRNEKTSKLDFLEFFCIFIFDASSELL